MVTELSIPDDYFIVQKHVYNNLNEILSSVDDLYSKFNVLIADFHSTSLSNTEYIRYLRELVAISEKSKNSISRLRKIAESIGELNEKNKFIMDREDTHKVIREALKQVVDSINMINIITKNKDRKIGDLVKNTYNEMNKIIPSAS